MRRETPLQTAKGHARGDLIEGQFFCDRVAPILIGSQYIWMSTSVIGHGVQVVIYVGARSITSRQGVTLAISFGVCSLHPWLPLGG
jgi:hypothetical protein